LHSIPLIQATGGVLWAKPCFDAKHTKDTKITKDKISASRCDGVIPD
jgi:hypothetical protein